MTTRMTTAERISESAKHLNWQIGDPHNGLPTLRRDEMLLHFAQRGMDLWVDGGYPGYKGRTPLTSLPSPHALRADALPGTLAGDIRAFFLPKYERAFRLAADIVHDLHERDRRQAEVAAEIAAALSGNPNTFSVYVDDLVIVPVLSMTYEQAVAVAKILGDG